MQMTDDFPVLDLSSRTVMILKVLGVTEYLHADMTVGKLFIWMPGAEMCHQVVFLVEVQVANKTLEFVFFLVL